MSEVHNRQHQGSVPRTPRRHPHAPQVERNSPQALQASDTAQGSRLPRLRPQAHRVQRQSTGTELRPISAPNAPALPSSCRSQAFFAASAIHCKGSFDQQQRREVLAELPLLRRDPLEGPAQLPASSPARGGARQWSSPRVGGIPSGRRSLGPPPPAAPAVGSSSQALYIERNVAAA